MKQIKNSIYRKLITLEILVIVLMSFLTPLLANYPPNSEVPEFQTQIEPITHTMQYILLGSFGTLLYIVLINLVFKDVFKYLENNDKSTVSFEKLEKVRKKCFNFPKQIIYVQLIVIMTVLIILFASMNLDIHLIFKFLLIYFSFFLTAALISEIVIKNDLDKIIKYTYDIKDEYVKIKKPTKFSNELLYNLLPFFIVVVVIISLLGYSKTSNAIGEENYYYYKLCLDQADMDDITDVDDLEDVLSEITLKDSENDYYFIVTPKETIISSENGEITDFFLKYAETYLDETNGRVYEYYGVEQEGYVQKMKLSDGDEVYFGFKYSTTNSDLMTYFLSIAFISTVVYIFILVMWSKKISKSIIEVTKNLSDIAEQNNISDFKNLPITNTNEIGQLTVAFNDIQKATKENIEQIESSQNRLIEQERLASLGQMIGGIAHNLKTPIMSISGATEGLSDLIKEYDSSIEDKSVNEQDHHEIAKDMSDWVAKIREHIEYMSDVITAVKGQAVALSTEENISFNVGELLKRVSVLMKHELANAIIELRISLKVNEKLELKGDVNSLVQVINNMISNSIQAYNGEKNQYIDLVVRRYRGNLIISIKDYASGMPKEVKDKLFKEMITTKGKNGTGLGLYMSYSTIKAHFNGEITIESTENKGSTFNIILPL